MNIRLNVSARPALPLMLALLAAGCASDGSLQRYVPQIVTPYRMDIQQGNFVTQEMVDKLAVGQTRDQVRFILGTPLLTDVFHANRWDYVFRFSRGWNEPERRRLVIYFDADSRVIKWDADVPAPAPSPAPAAAGAGDKPASAAPEKASGGGATAPGASAGAVPAPVATPLTAVAATTAPPTQAAAASADPVTPAPPPVAAAAPAAVAGARSDASAASNKPALPNSLPANVAPPAALADVDRTLAAATARPDASANDAPREVLSAVEAWRAAWAARDVDKYLAMYAPSFKPKAGMSRSKWEQQRRERLTRASFIVVKVVDPQVTIAGGDATAIFTQVYESDTLKETGRKKLALVQAGERSWRIREESFEK